MILQQGAPLRVLLVDDDEDDYIVTRDLLEDIPGSNYQLDWADNFEDGCNAIIRQAHDVYLLDFRLGSHNGLELLAIAKDSDCIAPLILLTGQGDKEVDEAAMEAGAADYLVKSKLDALQLERSIRYSLNQAKMLEELRIEREKLSERVAERTRELSIANVELAKAAKAKDEFLASMSHELRTPLTGILAMAEVLARELYGPLNDKQKHYLTTIEESGQHLLALINDILDIAKIEAGKLELNYSRVQIRAVCEGVLRLIKQNARKKSLNVELEIAQDIDSVMCDERRLKQMLVNLLGNAVKFTPAEGKVGLSVKRDNDGAHMLFTIWDTGIGIAEDRIAQLFQPFVQLDSSLARQYQGSGLGLALVDRMAKLHGGDVSLESVEGRGSRFCIRLPVPQEQQNDTMRHSDGSSEMELKSVRFSFDEQQPPLVLLAEDNELNVLIYRDHLETMGFRVQVASDGVEALAAVAKQKPNLILMDIQMPNMDGLEAISRLRHNDETKDLPIIALTALAMEGDRERILDAGADRYLSKPVKLTRLMQTIQNLLGLTIHD